LALAVSKSIITVYERTGTGLTAGLNNLTSYLAGELNAICQNKGIPIIFPFIWFIVENKTYSRPHGELLFTLMRDKGNSYLGSVPLFPYRNAYKGRCG